MDKIFSARLDESFLDEMDRIAHRLRMTKKEFLEGAIRLRVRELQAEYKTDIWRETLGAWKRDESPARTLERGKKAFRRSLNRRHSR